MNHQLIENVMDDALSQGCQDVRVVLLTNSEDNVTIRDGQTDQIQHSMARSLAINMLIDGRDGFFYTNNLDAGELRTFVRNGVEMTRLLTPDESRVLPDPDRYYRGGGPELHNFDATLADIPLADKLDLALQDNMQIAGADPRIISSETHYTDRSHRAWYLTSNGFRGYEECSRVTLSDVVTVDGTDGQHPMDGWGETRIRFDQMPRSGISTEALRRVLLKVGQHPVAGGSYTMIVESPVVDKLFQPLLSAMSGQALQQRMSFLADRLDQQVGSPLLDVVDDPLIPGTSGACHFDFDGVATQRRQLFSQGRLCTYFIDTPYGRRLGMAPTTQGPHHLIFTPGADDLPGLMRRFSDGILVTDFNGGNCDPVTGRFSYGIEGFRFQGGLIAEPVSGMNITGDLLQLWSSLVAVGNDADPWETRLIPSLVFSDVSFSGV